MKRKPLLLLIVTVLLVSSFAACSPSGQVSPTKTLMPTSTVEVQPSPTQEAVTRITIDGEPDDWADREVLHTDPEGDNEGGEFDWTDGYAFVNQHALYFYVEPADPRAEYVQFDILIRADSRKLTMSWQPASRDFGLWDTTDPSQDVYINGAPFSTLAFGAGLEGRVDLRDLGELADLSLEGVFILFGTCCDYVDWRVVDQWSPPSTPLVEEVDPQFLESEEAQTEQIGEADTTRIIVDGEPDDWADREVLLTDPEGDNEGGAFDWTNGYAFVNQDALYFMIEFSNPGTSSNRFGITLTVEESVIGIDWIPGEKTFPISEEGGSIIGYADTSQISLGSVFEARLELDEIGNPNVFTHLEIISNMFVDGNWAPMDVWTFPGSVPIVDEVDPQWLVSDEPQYEIARAFGLPMGYEVELIFEGPGASAAYLAKSDSGVVYVQHVGVFPRLSILDFEQRTIETIEELPRNAGTSMVTGGPGDTAFLMVDTEIRQYSPDGSYTVWGTSQIAFPLDYADGYGLFGHEHSIWSSIGELLPNDEYRLIADGLGHVFDLVVLSNGDFVFNNIDAGEIVRIDTQGERHVVYSGMARGEYFAIKEGPDGDIFMNYAELRRIDPVTTESEVYPINLLECSLNPGDFLFFDENRLIVIGAQTLWADLRSMETGILVYNPSATLAADIDPDDHLYMGFTGCGTDPPSRVVKVGQNGEFETYVDDLEGKLMDIAFTPEGDLYIAVAGDNDENRIFFKSRSGTELVELQDVPAGHLGSLVVDPTTGNLLVTRDGELTIFEMNTEGRIGEYSLSYSMQNPVFRLAFSPDGTLYALLYSQNWSVEGRTERLVMEIDQDSWEGTVIADVSTEEPIGTLNVFSIGPDGTIWVLVSPDQTMYKISPSGEVEVMGSSLPIDMYAIDIAPNGDIFFNASDGIFRIYWSGLE